MEYFVNDIIDGNSLTLNEFLNILLNENYQKLYPNNCFPSNEMLEEFIKTIKNTSDKDIKKIIFRFLIHEGTYRDNVLHKESIMENKELFRNISEKYPIYTNRLLLGKPWEGLTWLLDLLPHYPKDVITVLDSFFKVYCQFLPDDVIFGLSNIDQIIRAKYFEVDHPIEVLYNLSSEEFEYLIAELYEEMGYEIELTKKTHDNGIDIIAMNNGIAKKEMIIIQCKKYREKITVKDIRELIGIIEINNATKGVFCTTSDYTSSSKKMLRKYNRLEMLNGIEIVKLCNKHLETNWPIKIGTIFQKHQKINRDK
jgi:restriction system protein